MSQDQYEYKTVSGKTEDVEYEVYKLETAGWQYVSKQTKGNQTTVQLRREIENNSK